MARDMGSWKINCWVMDRINCRQFVNLIHLSITSVCVTNHPRFPLKLLVADKGMIPIKYANDWLKNKLLSVDNVELSELPVYHFVFTCALNIKSSFKHFLKPNKHGSWNKVCRFLRILAFLSHSECLQFRKFPSPTSPHHHEEYSLCGRIFRVTNRILWCSIQWHMPQLQGHKKCMCKRNAARHYSILYSDCNSFRLNAMQIDVDKCSY